MMIRKGISFIYKIVYLSDRVPLRWPESGILLSGEQNTTLLLSSFFSLSCLLPLQIFLDRLHSQYQLQHFVYWQGVGICESHYIHVAQSITTSILQRRCRKHPKKFQHNSGKSNAFLRQISGKYQPYMKQSSGKSQTYLRHILEKVWANLRYQVFLHICLQS